MPAYLAAGTPWEGSGNHRSAEDWHHARSHVADAVRDRYLELGKPPISSA